MTPSRKRKDLPANGSPAFLTLKRPSWRRDTNPSG
jgi:hypothetical protein